MTTLTTHDTKRSEDVRARLSVLAELPGEWAAWVRSTRDLAAPHRGSRLDPATEYLLLQTAVGASPITQERLQAYATKAIREAKQHTTWVDQDDAYEADVAAFVEALTTEPALVDQVATWVERAAPAARTTLFGQKLLQLVLPGSPTSTRAPSWSTSRSSTPTTVGRSTTPAGVTAWRGSTPVRSPATSTTRS